MPSLLGVDEKAIAKGHSYMTVVCDLEAATVEYIGEERREASLAAYFQAFPEESATQIEAISLDMWPAYINACQASVPQPDHKMVFDRFHIMGHVLEAGKVRKREHKTLMSQGDTTRPRASTCGSTARRMYRSDPKSVSRRSSLMNSRLRGHGHSRNPCARCETIKL